MLVVGAFIIGCHLTGTKDPGSNPGNVWGAICQLEYTALGIGLVSAQTG